ncbi:MAG: YesL family protein [Oscillospiraceae bacterium]|nr:YesL family protein [Oscillospiraceae bacterium]
MRERINAFLFNESSFGKLMTKLGIIIGANLMFVLFCMPVVTIGAAWAALDHVMLKTLRGDGVLNPFKQFWAGFKSNFKQATIAWLAVLAVAALGWVDVRFLLHMGGAMVKFRYAIYAVGVVLLIGVIYLFPTMAAFANRLPVLFRSGYYFAFKKPLKLLVLLFFHVFPLLLSYLDAQMMPLYAFIWTFFGFGAIAMLTAKLLLPQFKPLLPLVDDAGDFILDENGTPLMPGQEDQIPGEGAGEKSQAEILEEMKKLGM